MTAPLDPARTVVLAMDFQPGIVARIDDPGPLLARVATALAAAREAGAGVGYVRVAFTDADYDRVPAHSAFAAYAGDATARAAMADGAPATQVVAALAPHDGDIVVRKTRVGPFTTTDLAARLAERGTEAVVLAGLSTSGVVLSTVRQAADLDLRVVVLADGCADRDAEVHRVLMGSVFPRQADVVACADLPGLLAG